MLPVLCATTVPSGTPGGNRVVELLALQDRGHLGVGPAIDRLSLRDRAQQDLERPRRGLVVHPLVERLLILDAAQHDHAVGAESVDGVAHVGRADALDEQVGGEVAS